jgi:glycosyltransferase involved in cell wall biosynthesis
MSMNGRMLMISEYLPTWGLSGSRTRLAAVADWFRQRGHEIHLLLAQPQLAHVRCPPDARRLLRRISRLELAGHPEFEPPIATDRFLIHTRCGVNTGVLGRIWRRFEHCRGLSEQVKQLLIRERPQIVYVDHHWLAPLVHDLIPYHDCFWIVDTHDCLFLRDRTLAAAGLPLESGLSLEEEVALLEPFDLVIAIQEEERRLFQGMLPGKQVIAVPHCQKVQPQPCERPALGFVGCNADQNSMGLENFLRCAWPQIRRRCPEATLEIAGTVGETDGIRRIAGGDTRIRLLGVVKDTTSIYSGPAAMICPLWIGSGLKIKLVEALAFGKATVATPIAAQGCESGAGRAFVLAREPADFVEPLVELLARPERRRALERGATEFARKHFAPERIWAELDWILSQRLSRTGAPAVLPVPVRPAVEDGVAASPADAAARPVLIPKIIHQTWKDRRVPFDYLGFVDSWRRFHPNWEYRFWSDEDNRRFIAKHYPRFLARFEAYAEPIQRAQAVRCFLLEHFGGLFVDLDVRACKSIEPLLAGKTCVAGLARPSRARRGQGARPIGDAILAAIPRHPFLQAVTRRWQELGHSAGEDDTTGSSILTEVFDAFDHPESVELAAPAQLDPLNPLQADRYRATGHTVVDLSRAFAIRFHCRPLQPLADAA